ncbi:CYFA0S16e02146g1_1 [Cyberlindnera fabianii]|uniref:Guanine nucleotide-exchange factor SEC12 n=1 Tax=Cyberlindnera fabianii TaxID=36022 RepID=A0A061BDR1_CYBFA|nr:CYFA0S16e02146g1_1 [Cyberlindnera fabianii]
MSPKNSVTLDINYPLYTAQFTDSETLLVAGGGGEGNNGIPNKISSVSIDLDNAQSPLKVTGDFEFPGQNDSPTAIAAAKGTILVGVNESTKSIEAGTNRSLRKFEYSGIGQLKKSEKKESPFNFEKSIDVLNSKDFNDYIKLIALAKDASVAAVVSSKIPSSVQIINPETLEVKETVEEDKEIRDIGISPDGKKIAYITENSIVVLQDGEALTLTYNKFTSNYSLTKLKWATDNKLIIGVNLKNKAGVLLLESQLTTDEATKEPILKTKKARVFSNKFQKITGMDVVNDSFVVCTGNDNSITICDLDDFATLKRLEKVHTFAITKVVFSPNGKYIASVSAASTINVYKVPENIRVRYTNYYWALFFLLLAFAGYWVKQNVPREKFLAVTAYLDQLVDGEFSEDDPRRAYLSTQPIESTVTATSVVVVEEDTVIEEGDIVKVRTQSFIVDEEELEEKVEEKLSEKIGGSLL